MPKKDEIDEVLDELDLDGKKPSSKSETVTGDVFPARFATISPQAVSDTVDTNTREKPNKKDEEFQMFCSSVASGGMVVPLVVEDMRDGTYKLIDGSRRLMAAKEVGMRLVPAVIIDPKRQNPQVVAAITNLVRKDLSPVEEAKSLKVMIDKHGMKQEQLAKMIGRTQAHISHKLSLLKATKKDIEKLEKGKVSEHVVRKSVSDKSPRKKAEQSIKIPPAGLPEEMSMNIKGNKVSISMVFVLDEMKDLANQTRKTIMQIVKDMDERKINSAYKNARREME